MNATAGMPSDQYERSRQQLLLLAHAEKCRRLRGMRPMMQCQISQCTTLQWTLKHINGCVIKDGCPYRNCTASRRIMTHYKLCKNVETYCPVCDLLKFAMKADPHLFPEDLFEPYGLS